MSIDTGIAAFRRPFAWRELILQCWFIARVSMVPTFMLAIPFTVLTVFVLNILLLEIGAADMSGAGAALGAVSQIGPMVTVLVVSGAGATAVCADLGARVIREEIDAMRVLGIDPLQRLVLPRVIGSTAVALLLNSLVALVGLIGAFLFSVYVQHVTPGAFAAGLTLVTGASEVVVSIVKAGLFGLSAGLIACYRGLTVKGGPTGVGQAVNETVVFAFVALFFINVVVTAVGVKATA
ncbi:MlaE family ABC transporter permease [Nocardia sp. NPDC050630]|uniref:MlaE family ABC transporter permease n=1 Tax=Nocardia sp. NPDC050630 TaxID=3364321 RepID=UPI0037A64992